MKVVLQVAVLFATISTALSHSPYRIRRDTSSKVKYSCPGNVTFSNDNFPCPNDQQLADLEEQAHGTLLNLTLSGLGDWAITLLELGAFSESRQAAFFGTIATNISNSDPSFEFNQAVLNNLLTLRAVMLSAALSPPTTTPVLTINSAKRNSRHFP